MDKHVEIERKFIIKLPDFSILSSQPEHSESRIVQIYLEGETGVTHRIRSRSYGDTTVYTETKKQRIDSMSAIEQEREISLCEFDSLALKMKVGTRPIIKTRHTFSYGNKTVEIDIYPDWQRCAVLEVELLSREEEISLPDFIEIISEVTGDFRYSNASMARSFPLEPI